MTPLTYYIFYQYLPKISLTCVFSPEFTNLPHLFLLTRDDIQSV